jgi:hypothetical protein
MAQILFPVGRMIGGSLSKLFQSTDNAGAPKLDRTGQPAMRCSFGVAVKKGPEQHWNQTPWGREIWQAGVTGYPNGEYNAPTFAWKVVDGDSAIPNKKGKRPCDQEGYPGHWVIWFSQSWLPKKVNANGTQELTDPESIVSGYFVQVLGDCTDNKPSQSPGVYMNPVAVALSGFGERIVTADVDTTTVGFGAGPLPPGASVTPVGMTTPPAGMTPPPASAPPAMGGIVPAPEFLAPPPPPVKVEHVMAAKAGGVTYEAFVANGWTDAALIQNGYMLGDVPF